MTATNAGSIKIQLQAEAEKWNRAIDGAIARLERIGGAARRVSVTAGIAFAGMSAAVAKVTDSASEQRKAVARLTATAKANGKISAEGVRRLTQQAAALQTVTTFGDEATISMQSQLAAFNLNEQAVAALTPRVQDLAAALGKDLQSATSVIGRAVGGQIGGLSRYGVVLSKAEQATFNAASEGQRLAMILGKIDTAVGGTARIVANTAQGAMKQFGNAVGDVYEELGFILEQDTAKFFREMTRWVEKLIGWMAGLSDETKVFLARAARVTLIVTGVVAALSAFAAVLPAILAGLKAMAILTGALALPLLKIVILVAAVVAVAGAMRKAWEDNLGGVQEKFQTAVNYIGAGLDWVKGVARDAADLFSAVFEFAFRSVMRVFTAIPRMVIRGVSNIIAVLETLVDAARRAARFLGFEDTAKNLGKVTGALSTAKNTVRNVERSILDAIDTAAELSNPVNILKTAASFWGGPEGSSFLGDLGDALTTGGDYIADGLGLIMKDLFGGSNPLKKMLDGFGAVPDVPDADTPAAAGKVITEDMKRARESMVTTLDDLSAEFRAMRAGPLRDFVEITRDLSLRGDQLNVALANGVISATEHSQAMRELAGIAEQELAARVSARTNLRDFNAALEKARESAATLGVDFNSLAENVRFVPGDLSDVLNAKMSDVVASIIESMGEQISAADAGDISDTFSDALASMLEGGRLDFRSISSALGQLLGSTQAGSDVIGALLGGLGSSAVAGAGGGAAAGGAAGGVSGGPVGAAVGAAVAGAVAVAAPMVAQAFEAVAMGAGTAIKKVLFGLGEIIPEARLQKAIDEGINPLALGAAAVAAVLMPVLLPALLVTAGQFVFVSSVLAALAPVLLTVAAAMTAFVGFATLAGVVLGIFWAVAGAVVATLVTLVTAIGLAVGAIFVALNPVLAFGVIVAAGVIAVGMFLASVVAAAGAVLLLGAIFFSMVGFLAKLATETEAFGRISGMFEASVGRIIAALEPFVSSLTPIVGLFDGFADIIIAFAESVFSGDAIIRVVWETLKAFAVVLGGVVLAAAIVGSALLDVVTGVAYGVRSILGAIAGPVEFFIDAILTGVSFFVGEMAVILGLFSEGAASAMRDIQDEVNSFRSRNQVNMLQDALAGLAAAASQARPDIGAMSDALSNLAAMSMEEADARARNLAIMQEFGESLTNVPEAVKVSRLRYEAITPGLSGGSINPADSQESSGGRTINNYIDRLEIRAASVDDFLNQLEEASEEQSMRERGTTRGGGIQNNGR